MKNEIIEVGGSNRALTKRDKGLTICLSNGIDIDISREEYEKICDRLNADKRRLVKVVGVGLLNAAHFIGILEHHIIDDARRRKQGQWQDKTGGWHNRGDYECPMCGRVIPKGMKCGTCAR